MKPWLERAAWIAAAWIAAAWIVSTGTVHLHAKPQAPQAPSGTLSIADYEAPPSTLDALWAESPVVARGRIMGSSVRRHDVNMRSSQPLTAHDVELTDVYKDDKGAIGPGRHITVLQHGGSILDRNGSLVTALDDGFPVFAPGQELVMFLRPSPAEAGFSIAYGPAGSFLVERGDILVPDRVASYREFSGVKRLPAATLVSLLRQLASKR